MKKVRSFFALTILTLLAASFASELATAQGYPTRPVKIIVPYPPGGGNDIIARILAQKLAETGQQFYVENIPGAAGAVGTSRAVTAPPDGYTLVVVNPDFVVQPIVKAKVSVSFRSNTGRNGSLAITNRRCLRSNLKTKPISSRAFLSR